MFGVVHFKDFGSILFLPLKGGTGTQLVFQLKHLYKDTMYCTIVKHEGGFYNPHHVMDCHCKWPYRAICPIQRDSNNECTSNYIDPLLNVHDLFGRSVELSSRDGEERRISGIIGRTNTLYF